MTQKWKEQLIVLAAVVLLAAMAGCGSTGGKILDFIGLEPARTQQDRILYGFSQIELAASVTDRLVKERKLSTSSARRVLETLKIGQSVLETAALAYYKKDGAEVSAQLSRFEKNIEEVETILGTDVKPPPTPAPAVTPKPSSWIGAPLTV